MVFKSIATLPFPDVDPVLFRVGPLSVRWYGIAYLLGFFFAYWALVTLVRRGSLRLARESLPDLVSWCAVGVVVGGRLGWWLIYHRGDGIETPWYEPFAFWHGGMSFHGGLLGVIVAAYAWARRNAMPFWHVMDHLALVAPIGLFFGRVANFINAELVGRPSTLPWGVVFPGEALARHPSQLYEALLEGPLLVALLLLTRRQARRRDGPTAAGFLLLYGAFRFVVEFTREPDAQIGYLAFGWLTMGQLLSAGLVVIAAWLLWRGRADEPAERVGLNRHGVDSAPRSSYTSTGYTQSKGS